VPHRQQQSDWVPLDDDYNMVDEMSVPRDYYVDKPPTAQYIPDEEGNDKGIQLNDIQEGLFDFRIQAEPILQVLVGKALEHGRIEVIEEHEAYQLKAHKKNFKQNKEAMLMVTQQVEAARERREDEIKRRNQQLRVATVVAGAREKRQMARHFAQQWLTGWKNDNLRVLRDQGCLRSRRDYSLQGEYLPQLQRQIIQDMLGLEQEVKDVTSLVSDMAARKAVTHKQAILREFQRRADKAQAEQEAKDGAAAAKARRIERRMCLREQVRVGEVQEQITDEIYPNAAHDAEYSASVPIYDVRDYDDERAPGICTFGGFIGELLIVLTSIEQSIVSSNTEAYGFKFDAAQISTLLTEIFTEAAYPTNICAIKIPKELLNEDEQGEPLDRKAQIVGEKLLSSSNHGQFGMRFLIDTSKTEWGIVTENLIRETFIAMATIHYKEAEELVAVPEEDPENEDPKLEEKQDAAVA